MDFGFYFLGAFSLIGKKLGISTITNFTMTGLPWWSSGYDSMASNAGDMGSIPGQGTKIPYGVRRG